MGAFNFIFTDSATAWIRAIGHTTGLAFLESVDLSNAKLMMFGLALVLLMRLKPDGLFPSAQRRAELRGEATAPEQTLAPAVVEATE
jgi:branched-chain amino acid transport system permease protein